MPEMIETEIGLLPKHWQIKPFEEIIEKGSLSYGIVQPGFPKEHNSVPVIRVNNIKNGKIIPEDVMKVDEEIEAKYKRTRLKGGELLLTVVGSVGNAVIVTDEFINWNVARAVSVSRILNDYDKHFIKYCFLTEYVLHQMYGHTNDTVQPTLNLSSLKEIKFPVPPLPEQIQIASILSSLDDKIDLLHRQNKTLEQLAETLFRQWFVEEAEESWEKMPLSSIADFLNGLACQKFPPKNQIDKLPVLKIKELSSGISENSDWASSDIKSEYIIKNGDVIFAWSASLMVIIWNGEDCILNQHLFKVTSKVYPKWFYYLWCKHHLAEFISISLSHATTMGHIKRGDLDEAMVLVPTQEELKKMTISIQPFFDKMLINHNQIRTLTQLRDTLLPKLMSGEVGVM